MTSKATGIVPKHFIGFQGASMSSSKQALGTIFQRKKGSWLLLSIAGLMSMYSSCIYAAGFSTNFQPDATIWNGANTGYCTYGACTSHIGNTDPTPMGMTIVNIGGVYYFHAIVGDPATGFAVESYTRAAGLDVANSIPNTGGPFTPDGGGNERIVIGDTAANNTSFLQNSLNMSNSLGNYQVSGTGGTNPNFTVFRMVLNDPAGGMSIDVSKPFLDKKPLISQTVQDGSMKSVFVADERGLGYSDSSTPAPVTNTLVLNDPALPTTGAADFEMALAQSPDVTAGRFIFTPGTGWNDPTLGWNTPGSTFGQGTYTYVGGQGFDPLNFNWASVFNYADNVTGCEAPSTSGGNVSRGTVGIYNGTAADNTVAYDPLNPNNTVRGSCYNKP
jgi:hypothetical protein